MTEAAAEEARLLALARSAFAAHAGASVGVAVSGGGDSMALLHLMARARAGCGGTLRAVTVDHGLRPDSAAEALFVAGVCAGLGVAHDTVRWEHDALTGNLPDLARRARYRLIGGWARGAGVGHVVVAHTADDRAETFLMELARDAGLDGLTSMRGAWRAEGIAWSRPLLAAGREALRRYLRRNGVPWIDDPTNENEAYQRVKARRALAALSPLGITSGGLARVAGHLAAARRDLERLARQAADDIARCDAGAIRFDRARWTDLGEDTRRRLLVAALGWVSGAEYAPRAAQIARLDAAIRGGRDATLWGCCLRVDATGLCVLREPKAVAGLETPTDALWDGRWRLSGPHEAGLTVRALGPEGLRQCADWRATGRPRAVLVVSPAVWRGPALVAAPLAGRAAGWTAENVAVFGSALFSH